MSVSSNAKWSIIKTLAQTYALDILDALNKKPLRFSDLASTGPNERTRSQRLKELENLSLIRAESMKVGKRYFVHYALTDKGKLILQKVKEIVDSV